MTAGLTRRRVIVTSPDIVEVITEAVPPLKPGEALVEMSVSGMCGSDKAGVHGEHAFMKPPYYPGHEVVGVVVAVADGVDAVEVGDRVTIEPTLVCGHCKPCLNQKENLCENLEFFGCGYREGGMADVFSAPAARLHKIPKTSATTRRRSSSPWPRRCTPCGWSEIWLAKRWRFSARALSGC